MKASMVPTGVCVMGIKEQKNYDVCQRVILGDLDLTQASKLLCKSYRQTQRIVSQVRAKGMIGVKHGNLGKHPWNRHDDDLRENVLGLLENRYFDFNLQHFSEKLVAEHGIAVPRETLRRWAHTKNLVKKARKKRRAKIHRSRARMPRAGMLLQMDGSEHRWFGPKGPECSLIGAIDDATGICPFAEFFPAEDTLSVLSVMKKTVEKFGIPEFLYVDQAAHFGKIGTKAKYIDWEKHLTHLERAMNELGTRVLFATSPQAKGRIERMWGTFQDRLIPELRIRKVQRIPTGNYFLQNHFLHEFNQRFSKAATDPTPAWRPVPDALKERLDEIFCIREQRKVTSGETISWDGQTYSVDHDYDYSIQKLTIEIRTYINGAWKAFHAGKPVNLTPLKFLNKEAA